jgi:hypothetical protein
MYMAGMGDELDDILAADGVSTEEEQSWGQDSILPGWVQDIGGEIKDLGSGALDFYNRNKATVDALIKTGLTAKQAIEKLTGGGTQIPPSYNYTPPPPPTAPIFPPTIPKTTTPTFGPFKMIQAKLAIPSATVLKQLAAKKAEEQKKATNTLLIVGAVGVGAYFLLRKKK